MKFNGFGPVEDHVLPTKLLPIPLGIPDAGANSLAYDISFQFGHRANDGEHGLPHRCGSIESFLTTDKPGAEALELLQREDEVLD